MANGTITAVVVDSPGSGYSFAPGVAIHNGTLYDPIALDPGAIIGHGDHIAVHRRRSSWTLSVPATTTRQTVIITDPTGTGATGNRSAR